MATVQFRKATKTQSRLRMALDGPSGSGKTFTGLIFALALADGGKVAVIDTERGSASKYADMFGFDVLELDSYHPQNYIDGIAAAEDAGYAVVLIDSLSHAWEGEGGVLDLHDQATKRQRVENSWTAWRDVTPIHRELVNAILQSRCHVIVTMRSKMDYVQDKDGQGRTVIKKVGMAPVQRQGMEYEFDIVADLDVDHNLVVSKSRCFAVADAVVNKPDAKWFQTVKNWLTDGAPVQEPKPVAQAETVKRAEPETKATRWVDDTASVTAFWSWANETMTLTMLDVYAALGHISKLEEFQGSKKEAAEMIKQYIAEHAASDDADESAADRVPGQEGLL